MHRPQNYVEKSRILGLFERFYHSFGFNPYSACHGLTDVRRSTAPKKVLYLS
jgi:hypothetical protein